MKTKVKFFEERFTDAIEPGIYGIYKDGEDLLYIGESVCPLIRCATHLYEINKGIGYLGFKKEILENEDITIVFRLLENISDKAIRNSKEKVMIKQEHPRMQSEISDRVKSVDEMVNEMLKLLNK